MIHVGTGYGVCTSCTWLPLKARSCRNKPPSHSLTCLTHSFLSKAQLPPCTSLACFLRHPHKPPRLSAWSPLGSPRLRSSPACLVAGKAATTPCLLSAFSRRGGRETATRRHRRQPPPAPLLRLRLRPRRRLHLQPLLQHLHPRPLTGLFIKSPRRVRRRPRRSRAPHRWEWPRYQPRPEEEEEEEEEYM